VREERVKKRGHHERFFTLNGYQKRLSAEEKYYWGRKSVGASRFPAPARRQGKWEGEFSQGVSRPSRRFIRKTGGNQKKGRLPRFVETRLRKRRNSDRSVCMRWRPPERRYDLDKPGSVSRCVRGKEGEGKRSVSAPQQQPN